MKTLHPETHSRFCMNTACCKERVGPPFQTTDLTVRRWRSEPPKANECTREPCCGDGFIAEEVKVFTSPPQIYAEKGVGACCAQAHTEAFADPQPDFQITKKVKNVLTL